MMARALAAWASRQPAGPASPQAPVIPANAGSSRGRPVRGRPPGSRGCRDSEPGTDASDLPGCGRSYRYRLEESEGSFTFELEGEVRRACQTAIDFSIESRFPPPSGGDGRRACAALNPAGPTPSRGPGSARSCTCGWMATCSCSSGRSLRPARGGGGATLPPPKRPGMSWLPCPARCWRCWSAKGIGWSETRPSW